MTTTREDAIGGRVCMTPGTCDDCREPFASYMVIDEVWRETGLPEYGALICLPCLEVRIGRAVRDGDLLDCPANDHLRGRAA
jgi:hypothetical protein